MARTSARQRRLANARARPLEPPASTAEPAQAVNLARFVLPVCMVVSTPILVAIATRHDHSGALSAGIRLTVAALLFQSAIVAAYILRDHQRGSGGRPSSLLVATTAVLAGAALVVTATIPVLAWFAGLAMFACFLVDAATARRNPLRWAFVSFGVAFLCCWAFAGAHRWDTALWWTFPLAAFAAVALNSAAPRQSAQQRSPRASLGGALAGVGLLSSTAAIVIAWRSPGAAILIAIEGAFALLLIQRAARRFGLPGAFGVASAACLLATVVFIVAL